MGAKIAAGSCAKVSGGITAAACRDSLGHLKHFSAQAHVLDEAQVGVLGISMGSFVTR